MVNAKMEELPLEDIVPNPFQPRKSFREDDIHSLAASIKANGLIQPIIVREHHGRFQIIAGERRYRACKSLGVSKIMSIVVDHAELEIPAMSIIENVQREDLNCIEEAEAYLSLVERFGLTHEEIASQIGKSRSHVANTIRLLQLPDHIKNAVMESRITMGHARVLLSVKGEDDQKMLFELIESEGLNVRQLEKMAGKFAPDRKTSSGDKKISGSKPKYSIDARIYYNTIRQALSEIQDKGGQCDLFERETEDFFEIVVRIEKRSKGKN